MASFAVTIQEINAFEDDPEAACAGPQLMEGMARVVALFIAPVLNENKGRTNIYDPAISLGFDHDVGDLMAGSGRRPLRHGQLVLQPLAP